MNEFKLTEAQLKAVESLEGSIFVAAGAGSGKTGVVTRRFVHAIVTGKAEVDQILTITFTRKAAAEMMSRIRKDLRDRTTAYDKLDEDQLRRIAIAYRDIERAQISTIDSFYSTILRANALAAGIDPNFTVMDESQARILQEEVFESCLKKVVEENGSAGMEFITAYDPELSGQLLAIVAKAYETLRSQGREVTLPQPAPPDARAAEKALRQSLDEAQAAFVQLKKPTATQTKMFDRLDEYVAALAGADAAERVRLAAREFKAGNCGCVRDEFERVEQARAAFVSANRSQLAVNTLDLFRKLLESFDSEYSLAKRNREMLDFADLSIFTKNLLKDNKSVAASVAGRYKLIMVDEYQDTNPLQNEIIALIAGGNLMVVGDENQAIYGFRNAEVGLFQQEKERARAQGRLIELKQNFRSQKQILDFVDFIFNSEDMLQPGYLSLEPASAEDEPEDIRVEVILVDSGKPDKKQGIKPVPVDVTRRAEAHLIAERLQALFRQGYKPGDAAMLVLSRNGSEVYRDALSRAGIESYFAVSTSYFSKLELLDVISMIQIVINPQDDLSLIAVLRSPLAGLSDDALYWFRNCEQAADPDYPETLWEVLAHPGPLAALSEKDRKALDSFMERFRLLRSGSGRDSLRTLIRKILSFNDYGATVAASDEGRQKLANLFKLVDLAQDFETSWGRDIAAFTDFLKHQQDSEAREVEAPTEEEDVTAVRIMTMHGAKGLEFPLVVLPKLQANGNHRSETLMIDRRGKGRVGLRYRGHEGADGNAFDFEELKAELAERESQELKRLLYVAMTRAKKHLLLTGVARADKPPEQKKKERPFDWIRNSLGLNWERDAGFGSADRIETAKGDVIGLNICVDPQTVAARRSNGSGGADSRVPPALDPEIMKMPDVAAIVPAAISPTALDAIRACPRRYYLENMLGAAELREATTTKNQTDSEPALSAMEMGTLVHKILEEDLLILESPIGRESMEKRLEQACGKAPHLSDADIDRANRLVDNFRRSAVAASLPSAGRDGRLRREVPFSTLIGQTTILRGAIDVLCLPEKEGGASLVVDYKTGSPQEGLSPAEAAKTYRLQMVSYALAAAKMNQGPVRVVLLYLGGDDPIEVVQDFPAGDIGKLEAEIQGTIDSISDGSFPPLEEVNEYYCNWCAGGRNGSRLCVRAV
ncbi:MAG: UvrD-helicase domain-containing protein [Actinobacteria bacterium]|nr:UvrD-helicase domain-containing protein [Actinomycetota bacterium]